MFSRTKHRTVHFSEPFQLPDVEGVLAAGDYEVDDDEELIEGISWLAYHRVATFIKVPATADNDHRMRMVAIAPDELDRIIAIDRAKHAFVPAPQP
ncbi:MULTISPECIES: hypothetical protein [Ensifer]|jgi:hypothetical protein|uniref:Uncharacterized protein n=1 Tax=Ensifer canadensis TaxID=555315 RepID=A0AAW4FMV3_9HYPH|nr:MULTISPECIES: hypothetical protein [Ensifer]MDP9634182.1 hypothetical protein [Ensifer adhaerens]KQU93584.1 hypothetical protein ASD00_23110 [Ensifer sp. Root31]KQW58576.1 hypothetical protein ASD02_06145 [Ensifer sp. Root1252]KQW74279.1 hypothetical protein ASD03_06780 [Ensifer sp. Root127]KQY78551.1 hypothetical protein ASD52_01445 [Ensifer sp. Root142]